MFCGNCGKEQNEGSLFCGNCGIKREEIFSAHSSVINDKTVHFSQIPNVATLPSPEYREIKIRHGFASFWLWISLIGSVFGFLGLIFVWLVYEEIGLGEIVHFFYPELDSQIWLYWLMAVSIATVVGLWKIIKSWQRRGFYWLVIASISTIILVFVYFPHEVGSVIISCLIFPGLTFAILHIRNDYNAKNTWEQLDK